MRMMMPSLLICCEGKTEQKYFQILQRIYIESINAQSTSCGKQFS